MNKLAKISAAALLVLGVLLAIFAFVISNKSPKTLGAKKILPSNAQPLVNVVVASKDLPAGHAIGVKDLLVQQLAQAPNGAFGSVDTIVGRTTAVDIPQAATLLTSQLIDGVAGLIGEGERAVSIKVDEASAVGHKIRPGDWVDVFVVLRKDNQEVGATQSRMLLPRRKVIAYGAHIHGQPKDEQAKSKETSSTVARTAVIAVKVEEVNRLLLAEQQGQVQLALRNPLDQNEPSADMLKQLPGLSVHNVLNQDVSDATAALNMSLASIKFEDLAKDVHFKPVQTGSEKIRKTTMGVRSGNQRVQGASVEVIRGGRKEVIRY